jgi:hypothetical protein
MCGEMEKSTQRWVEIDSAYLEIDRESVCKCAWR